MNRRRRVRILTIAAGCSIAIVAAPAQAATGDTTTCRIAGAMGFTPGAALNLGPIDYQIAADVTCAYGGVSTPVLATGSMYSSGRVNNLGCGNGFGFGSLQSGTTQIDFPAGSGVPDVVDVRYLFAVAGWQAPVDITGATAANGSLGDGAGQFSLLPSGGGGCLSDGITTFDLQGSLTISWTDPDRR